MRRVSFELQRIDRKTDVVYKTKVILDLDQE